MQGAKWNAAIANLTNLTTAAESGKRAAYMRTMPGKSAKPSKPKSLPRREPAGYSFNNRRVLKWNIKSHAKPMPQKGVKKPSKREVYPTENNSYKSVVLQLIEGSDRSPHKFADVASAIKFLQSYGKVGSVRAHLIAGAAVVPARAPRRGGRHSRAHCCPIAALLALWLLLLLAIPGAVKRPSCRAHIRRRKRVCGRPGGRARWFGPACTKRSSSEKSTISTPTGTSLVSRTRRSRLVTAKGLPAVSPGAGEARAGRRVRSRRKLVEPPRIRACWCRHVLRTRPPISSTLHGRQLPSSRQWVDPGKVSRTSWRAHRCGIRGRSTSLGATLCSVNARSSMFKPRFRKCTKIKLSDSSFI